MRQKDLTQLAVYTTGQVARICGVCPATAKKWFDSGQLKGYRIPGSGDRRVPREALVRFMRDNNMPLNGLEPTDTQALQAIVSGLAGRVAAQSELLSHRAETKEAT